MNVRSPRHRSSPRRIRRRESRQRQRARPRCPAPGTTSRSRKGTATEASRVDSRDALSGGSAHGVVASASRNQMLRREDVGAAFREFCDAQHDIDHDRVETEETRRCTHAFTLMSVVVAIEGM